MMEEVVTPFVIENYGKGIYYGSGIGASPKLCPSAAMEESSFDVSSMYINSFADEIERCVTKEESNMQNTKHQISTIFNEESLLKMITGTEDDKIEFPKLQKLAMKQLNLVPENIPEKAKASLALTCGTS